MKTKQARNLKTNKEVQLEKAYIKEFKKKYQTPEDMYFEKMESKRNNWL